MAAGNLGLGKLREATYSAQLQMSWKFTENYFVIYKNTRANNHRRGAPWWAQDTRACQAPQARPGGLCPPRPTSGAHLLVYIWPRKNHGGGGISGRSTAVSRRNLGRNTFALQRSDSAGGTSLPEGEIIIVIITNNSPILGRAISINIFNSTISSQTLVHLLCSIFVPEL